MEDYADFVRELEQHFDSIIKKVAPVGKRLTSKIESEPNDQLAVITHDILKRLVSNIRVLKGIKISNDTCVAYRLILRATTADLIECFYMLAVSEEKRKNEIWRRNLNCIRTLEIYATKKKKFFEKFPQNNMEEVDLSRLYKVYSDYVDPATNQFYSKQKYRSKDTASLIRGLIQDGLCASEFEQLYINYRILSLTEHYSLEGRIHSYIIENDHFIIKDVVRWIAFISPIICDAITEYLDTGKIIVEKLDE